MNEVFIFDLSRSFKLWDTLEIASIFFKKIILKMNVKVVVMKSYCICLSLILIVFLSWILCKFSVYKSNVNSKSGILSFFTAPEAVWIDFSHSSFISMQIEIRFHLVCYMKRLWFWRKKYLFFFWKFFFLKKNLTHYRYRET